MRRSIRDLVAAALLLAAAQFYAPVDLAAQGIGPGPGCTISGGTITCGGSSLTPVTAPCTTTALSLQYNNAGAFGCVSGWTTNGTTALTGGASSTVAIGGATIGTNALAVTGTANVSGALTLGNGTTSVPSINFGTTNTGFYQNQASQFTAIVGAASVLKFEGSNIGLQVNNGYGIAFARSSNFGNLDVYVTPGAAAATLTVGNYAGGTPVAQTLAFENASGTNIAAAPQATVVAPLGTGTGVNGDFVFKTGVKVGSGSGAPTQTTALTIKGETQQSQFALGTSASPSIVFGTDNTGWYRSSSNVWSFSNGSAIIMTLDNGGTNLQQTQQLAWTGGNSNGSRTSVISQASAGLLQIGTTTNNALGSLNLTAMTATGLVTSATLTVTTMANVATTSAVCYNTATGVVTYDGTLGTCTVSDEWLKNIGERIPDALARLLSINGVYYTWKDQAMGTGRQIGVGAQTVEAVFPELVSTDSLGHKSADYQRLTAPIIEAMRELNDRVVKLEAR